MLTTLSVLLTLLLGLFASPAAVLAGSLRPAYAAPVGHFYRVNFIIFLPFVEDLENTVGGWPRVRGARASASALSLEYGPSS